MAWNSINKVIGGNGQVTMTPGYLTETIDLPDMSVGGNQDAVTSHIPYPVKSDFTILVIISDASGTANMAADAYLQVEHSIDGVNYVKRGDIETLAGAPVTTDISHDMSKIGVIDISIGHESDGMMFIYKVDTHGMSPYTRFAIKDNSQDESANKATFYIIPHY